MNEPAFDYLRTKQKLGYSVLLRDWHSNNRYDSQCGILLKVENQVSQYSVDYVSAVIRTFWRRIAPRFIGFMSTEDYKTCVCFRFLFFWKLLNIFAFFKFNLMIIIFLYLKILDKWICFVFTTRRCAYVLWIQSKLGWNYWRFFYIWLSGTTCRFLKFI